MFQNHIRRTALACILLGMISVPNSTFGTDWTGAVDLDWNTPGNWNTGVVPTASDNVYFSGSGGLIFLSGASQTARSVIFSGSGIGSYTLYGGPLDLGAVGSHDLLVGDFSTQASATISSVISGPGNITTGADNDRLILSGANTFTGAVNMFQGILNIRNDSALGSTAAGTNISAGTTLEIEGNISVDEPLTLNNSGFLRNVSGDNRWGNIVVDYGGTIASDAGTLEINPASGDAITGISNPSNFYFGGNGDIIVSKPVNLGGGDIRKIDGGRTTLAVANTYTGSTYINGGALRIQNGGGLGSTSGYTYVNAGGTLELEGNITVTGEAISLAGNGNGVSGALRNISGQNTIAGNTTLTANALITSLADKLILNPATGNALSGSSVVTFGGGGEIVVEKPISLSGGGITKIDLGRATLASANTFDGAVLVNGGTLVIQNSSGLGSALGSSSVTSGGTLELQGGLNILNEVINLAGTGDAGTGALRSASGSNQINSTISLSGNALINADADSLTLNSSGTAVSATDRDLTLGGSGDISVPGAIVLGNGGLSKEGSGRAILTAGNTYGGITYVSAGYLDIRHSGALGSTAGGTVVNSGGALDVQGDITINDEPLTLNGIGPAGEGALRNVSGDNQVNGTIGISGFVLIGSDSGKLTINPSSGDALTGAGAFVFIGGNGEIVIDKPLNIAGTTMSKVGPGDLTLSATSPYTGPTDVMGGNLIVTGDISASVATTIQAGGTLSGDGKVGVLSVNSSGTLAPGDGLGILDSSAAMFDDATFDIQIHGVTAGTEYDQLDVTGSVTISTDTELLIDLGVFDPLDDGSQTFTIIENDLADLLTLGGRFTSGGTPLNEGDLFSTGGQFFSISYTGGSGNDVVLTAVVPEPSTAMLLLTALGLGLTRRRRITHH